MSLSKRLDKLRAQAGALASTSTAPKTESTGLANSTQPSLRERLERSQLRSTKKNKPIAQRTPGSPAGDSLAALLGGQRLAGGVIEIEVQIGLHSSYGKQPLAPLRNSLEHLPAGAQLRPDKAVFLDIETTGLTGGTGNIAFLIGAGRLIGPNLLIKQWLLNDFGAEPNQLKQLIGTLSDAQGVVSYNGKSFDVPLLKSRTRLNGIEMRIDELIHLDLLHPTRRAFRKSWPNCRLITAEKHLLGRERIDDLPGAEAPAAWLDYLQRGNPRHLSDVLQHNADDIVALAALWAALDRHYADHQ